MTPEETVKKIKAEFRRGMNGVVASSMREKGVSYKLNFGLTLPILKEISGHYPKDADIAESLWREDIRESRLLAPMLYPAEDMGTETAKRWISEIPNTEVADICVMFLLSKLPYAKELAYAYSASGRELDNYISLSLFNRLAMGGEITEEERSDIEAVAERHITGPSPALAIAAMRLLDRFR